MRILSALLLLVTTAASLASCGYGCDCDVAPPELRELTLEPPNALIGLHKQQGFTCTATRSDGMVVEVAPGLAAWTSSDPAVAAVEGGIATGLDVGLASITARYEGVSGRATLTVRERALVTLTVSPDRVVLAPHETQQFTAEATFDDGARADLTSLATWYSSDNAVATVSGQGLATAVAEGKAGIQALLKSRSSMALVTVPEPKTIGLKIKPASASVERGTMVQLTAVAAREDGTLKDVTALAEWSSHDPEVAMVQEGRVRALAAGTTTITASYKGVTSSPAVLSVW
jgi:trimeric autotransporter adhesin